MAIGEESYRILDEERVEEALRLSRKVQQEAQRLKSMFETYRPSSAHVQSRSDKNSTNGNGIKPTDIARQLAEVDFLLKQLSPWEDSRLVPPDAQQVLRERYLEAEEIYLRAEKKVGLDPLYAAYVAYIAFSRQQYGYLDSQGIMQTERAVTLPLDEVYISLNAERESDDLSAWRIQREEETLPQFHERLLAQRERPSRPIPLDQVVRSHSRIVVLGDPGSGKTTLLRFLAARFAEAHSVGAEEVLDKAARSYGPTRLPIFFRVAAYAEARERYGASLSVRDFLPLVYSSLSSLSQGLTRLLMGALEAGTVIVLVDGLDEIASGRSRKETLNAIAEFISDYPKNRYLITSRIAGYHESPLAGWVAEATYILREMEEVQVEHFLTNWCRAVERFQRTSATEQEIEALAQAEKTALMNAYRTQEGVRRLAKNPLLLTILSLIKRNGVQLPERRVELYETAAKTLLNNWILKKGLTTETIDPAQAEALLGPLALNMHACTNTGLITEKQALEVIGRAEAKRRRVPEDDTDVLATAKIFLQKVRLRAGILAERAPGYYGFLHLTFEEYYAGLELVKNPYTAIERMRAIRRLPRWEEPIRLAVAHQNDEVARIWIEEAILSEDPNPIQHLIDTILFRNWILACHCAVDCGDILTALTCYLKQETAVFCLKHNVNSEIENSLFACLHDLGKLKCGGKALALLLSSLNDHEPSVRSNAAKALGQLGQASETVVNALLKHLKDREPSVRSSAVTALGRLGQASETVVNALLDLLTDDEPVYTSGHLFVTLSTIRHSTAMALGQLGKNSNTVISALSDILMDKKVDEYGFTHSSAAMALGQLGQASETVVNALLKHLKDREPSVRSSAVTALGRLGQASETVVNALLDLLTDKEPLVRNCAAWALGQLGQASETVVNALLNLLKDREPSVRSSAATALGRLGQASETVVNALLKHLKDRDTLVRNSAATALGQLGQASETVVNTILELLKDKETFVRGSAASALGQLGQASETVVNALLELLKDKETFVRGSAASALGQLGQASETVINALLMAINDGSVSRSIAATALDKLTSRSDQAANHLGVSC